MIRVVIFLFLAFLTTTVNAQFKKPFKFSTFYVAANGGTSLADENIYSVRVVWTWSDF